MNKSIGIIGGGNMGGAMFKTLAESKYHRDLYISDQDFDKLRNLGANFSTEEFTKKFSTDANDTIKKSEIIILAIKPQSFEDFAANISTSLINKMIVSIMAGVSVERISKALNCHKIVRTMPNLAAQVSKGLTGIFYSNTIIYDDKKVIRDIFEYFGKYTEVKTEEDLNKITALSGSGPAYFFHLTKILEEKARELGFHEVEARKIAENTFIGAARILEENEMTAEQWEKAVCSPGGTTEAALKSMTQNSFDEIFKNGIDAANQRANELS